MRWVIGTIAAANIARFVRAGIVIATVRHERRQHMNAAQLLNLHRHKATRPGLFGPRKMTMHVKSPLPEDPGNWGWRDKVNTAPATKTNRLDARYWSFR